jgi:hypothetical protein
MVTPQTPGVPDHGTTTRTIGWSPKAVWTLVASIVAPLALQALAAIVEAVSANPALFDGLPTGVVWTINLVVTALGVVIAGRQASPGTVVTTPNRNTDPSM